MLRSPPLILQAATPVRVWMPVADGGAWRNLDPSEAGFVASGGGAGRPH